jgi:hypothetical protein
LLALACGYTFTPILILAHAVSFPDAFVSGSVLGGSQTTAWLWVGWHGLFPMFLTGYALLAPPADAVIVRKTPSALAQHASLFATLGLALGVIALATWGESLLPKLFIDARYVQRTPAVLALSWSAHLVALALLVVRTRLRRRLDLWLAVTLLAWLLDVALSAVLVTGRYQFGFYFGRLYGLLGASGVLAILLRETLELYRAAVQSTRHLASARSALRSANDTRSRAYRGAGGRDARAACAGAAPGHRARGRAQALRAGAA